jgi:hypothetical protein
MSFFDLRLLITPLVSSLFCNGIQLAKFGLLIDTTSIICMKVRIKSLASVIIGHILPQREKERITRQGAQLIPMGMPMIYLLINVPSNVRLIRFA